MYTELIKKIEQLKKEKSAVILAHNYQAVEIQDLADYRGDSLQLSILASELKAPLIVFCGVRFMAETAALLNPTSDILLPALDAGCPMADMIDAAQLREFQGRYPGSPVVCYVNSSVQVKAESDICCTSANAVKVLQSFPADKPILFVPDKNLGAWAGKQAGREVITWNGYCPVHQWGFSEQDVLAKRAKYPDYVLLAHPECDTDILKHADFILSTGGMMKWISTGDKAIIATENAFTKYLKHIYPKKRIEPLSPQANCKNMKKTTLEHVYQALLNHQHVITVDPAIADKARRSITRMLEL
ncbi:MAG: quinolinate synthase [Candidatus Cloacimonetes bacterium HGW-Cloacimonetes-3]|jgi:quinolinate synthase|nr:MAG: quinolinate synthase [Candidatus Cloacimonetes bacterium HGW-Cloacimonetes-3]